MSFWRAPNASKYLIDSLLVREHCMQPQQQWQQPPPLPPQKTLENLAWSKKCWKISLAQFLDKRRRLGVLTWSWCPGSKENQPLLLQNRVKNVAIRPCVSLWTCGNLRHLQIRTAILPRTAVTSSLLFHEQRVLGVPSERAIIWVNFWSDPSQLTGFPGLFSCNFLRTNQASKRRMDRTSHRPGFLSETPNKDFKSERKLARQRILRRWSKKQPRFLLSCSKRIHNNLLLLLLLHNP